MRKLCCVRWTKVEIVILVRYSPRLAILRPESRSWRQATF